MAWDIDKLADEIARVATPRLGWPLRSDAKTDQLRDIAKALIDRAPTDDYLLYEKVLPPSIESLGKGPMGRLARIEFGLTNESKDQSFLKQRRDLALKELGIRPNAIERLERDMHLAIARDLVARWETSHPGPRPADATYAGMTAEERDRAMFLSAARRIAERVNRRYDQEVMAGERIWEPVEGREKGIEARLAKEES